MLICYIVGWDIYGGTHVKKPLLTLLFDGYSSESGIEKAFYLLEVCFGSLLRADMNRPVQGNLFPCLSVNLGSHTTTQIP
jgi:hypothetical protein